MLEVLNRDTSEWIKSCEGHEIYVGGGAGAARFDDAGCAREFCKLLEHNYRSETTIAGITTWIEPQRDGEGFPACVERAEYGLRRRKEGKARDVALMANPYYKVCELCGRMPAEGKPVDETHICCACRAQMEHANLYKHSPMYQAIERASGPAPINWPESLEDIGRASVPEGYIGLIYSDGNRMGKRRQDALKECNPHEAEERYRRFSACVDKATRWAMVDAVMESLPPGASGNSCPVQFFITGGDDMLAAVPAHLAMPMALRFAELFEGYYRYGRTNGDAAESFAGMENRASVAIGVALAKQNYPLHSLIKTARELQKSAKQRAWRERVTDTSTIDFLATASSLLQPVQHQRATELEYENLRLTRRPYTVGEARDLLDLIRGLKRSGFPRNKVNMLWRPLYGGFLGASLNYLVLLSRLSEKGDPSPRRALLEVGHRFQLAPLPWRFTDELTYSTPLLDLAELYDFVPE